MSLSLSLSILLYYTLYSSSVFISLPLFLFTATILSLLLYQVDYHVDSLTLDSLASAHCIREDYLFAR